MKTKCVWLGLSFLMVAAMLLASCNSATTMSTSMPTTTAVSTVSTVTNTNTSIATSTTALSPTTTVTTSTTGNWWNSLGTPQYGGSITFRINTNIVNFDPINSRSLATIQSGWMERCFKDDWTLDPSVFNYQLQFRPSQFVTGDLAQSWEFTDPTTFTIKLRQNIYWQNLPPANARQFIADDVAYHYNRQYGVGGYGFTTPNAVGQAAAQWRYLVSVTATDKYTVVFKWSIPNPEFITEVMESAGKSDACIECPDAVKSWGDVNNWQHAIGTGPFILTDFIDGSSATLVKNPGYWGTDERYPQNKLPYIDKLIVLIIPDDSTALAGLRTGKIDVVDATLAQTAQQVAKTNPQISQISVPYVCGFSLDPRNDMKPFNDIRVREAMQMAINLPQIATTYYLGAASPNPVTLTSQYMVGGWGSPYDQWPQALKDQFAYNPTAATQLLAAAGYPNGFTTDIVVDTAYDMNLLQIVKAEFAAININLNITALDLPSWNAFVQTNHKNDALATRSTSGIMGNTYEPMIAVNKFLTGNYGADWAMVSDPGYDALYAQAMAATSTDSAKQIMKNVNEYVAQQHYVISLLQPVTFSLVQPWLKGYSGQYGATYGSSGPPFLFFYAARFWIAK